MGSNQSLRIKILSGEKQVGKTTWLENNLSNCGGFLSPVRKGKRVFLLLPDQQELPMEDVNGTLKVGRFTFSEPSFDEAESHVLAQLQSPCIVIDEIGPLELQGLGFAKLLKEVIQNYTGLLILVVRKGIVPEVIEHFKFSQLTPETFTFEEVKKGSSLINFRNF